MNCQKSLHVYDVRGERGKKEVADNITELKMNPR